MENICPGFRDGGAARIYTGAEQGLRFVARDFGRVSTYDLFWRQILQIVTLHL